MIEFAGSLLLNLAYFAAFLAVTSLVVFPFYYAVLSSADRGEDRTGAGLFWNIMFWLVVVLICLIAIFPFYYAILTSLETGTAIFRVNYLPESFDLRNYESVLGGRSFVRSVLNSVFIAATTVIFALFLAVTASYALARVRFRGRGLLLMTILAVSMFPQIAVLSGLFELINWLGIYNTPWALILSYTIFTLPFTVWVLTTFMRDLPVEIEEAAIVDGATPWVIISKVFLPLLWPALVTTGLLAFIGAWNEFLFALTFTVDETKRTVPVAIALLSGASEQEIPWGPIMAASVIVTVPLIVLVLVFQRKIVAGLTAGGVKG
ncbi:Maltose/maltodextrin ABC transporter, permease protein MalG [Rubellimicrobium mesophilum DSM 19309]|uniref:Maltose/maltodextrin ABC transporter, permease protein MalG n=1 Tax=Rubellimicrobium mesophilum DSM 19309 TaxID=442562 RepID=A0A017HIF9_9RHOB|nr:carbohydrate ABC transporter permease [Rubellimicrobium mesophilum]EYD74100.1 Maltose/maltodextrin ABC transporter, permease protein MalG [Rubellimicrobium mesophilum DSM 19309]